MAKFTLDYTGKQVNEAVGLAFKLNYINIAYGTCNTAADVVEKVITIIGNDTWALEVGSIVVVRFSTTNTAQNSILNVNETGAKAIYHKDAAIKAGVINAGDIAIFIYDGTRYHLIAIDSTEQLFTGTIATTDWTEYAAGYSDCTITVEGLNLNASFDVDLNLPSPSVDTISTIISQSDAWGNMLRIYTTADNTIRFIYKGTAPTVALPIKIRWRR